MTDLKTILLRLQCLLRGQKTGIREKYPQYEIGRGTYGVPEILSWGEGTTFKIGNYCSIAKNVKIFLGGEHRIDWVTTYPFSVLWESAKSYKGHPRSKGDVIIGHDVWIGNGAVIMSGVTVGSGAVIGGGALVSKDVPPYGIVAGNPAVLLRKRFADDLIARLLAARWWDLEEKELQSLMGLLLSSEVERFLEKVEEIRGRG